MSLKLWHNRQQSVGYLRVFGCKCYVFLTKADRRCKLDPKAIQCIFVGYADASEAYRLFDVARLKILVPRDVTFDDNSMHDASDCIEKGPAVILPVGQVDDESQVRSVRSQY